MIDISPDFKVIADYPESPFKIGDLLKYDGVVFGTGEPQCFVRSPEKYPKVFQKLELSREEFGDNICDNCGSPLYEDGIFLKCKGCNH